MISTSVWAFGGVGIFGHKSHHSSGVSSIGVHYNGTDNKPNIDIRSCDSETEELVGSECLPKCPDGLERNTDNSCTICKNKNVYLSYMDDPCGTETPMNQQECEVGSDCWWGQGGDTCCVNGKCRAGVYNANDDLFVCPEIDKIACKSNADCKVGEFCNITSTECNDMPSLGTCTTLGEYVEPEEEIIGLGKVRGSTITLSWWGAENWCKAQGLRLISIEEFKCYDTGTNTLISELSTLNGSVCCAGNGTSCDAVDDWYLDDNKENYSVILYELYKTFGAQAFWTASRSTPVNYAKFGVGLDTASVYDDGLCALDYNVLCVK